MRLAIGEGLGFVLLIMLNYGVVGRAVVVLLSRIENAVEIVVFLS